MMRYCDTNTKVIKWASEEIIIPYYNPVKKRMAKYYPDFYMEVVTKENKKEKILIFFLFGISFLGKGCPFFFLRSRSEVSAS